MICQELYNNVVIYISFFLWNIISLKLFITMPTIETFSWTMIQHILNGPLRPSTSMFTKGLVASNMQNLVVYLLGFALLHLSEVWFYSSCLFFFLFSTHQAQFQWGGSAGGSAGSINLKDGAYFSHDLWYWYSHV